MTDKKEIIIDGVDVSGCEKYPLSNKWHGSIIFCKGGCNVYPNCEYKQLQRKTAECEELKKKFSKFFNIDNQECWDIAFLKDENARYKQALDEIEENCLKAQDPCQEDWDRKTENFAKPILDIIRKAKGANVENT